MQELRQIKKEQFALFECLLNIKCLFLYKKL